MSDDLLARIKDALDACEGMWILPDDAGDLAQLCEGAVRRALGGEWLRVGGGARYEVGDEEAD